MLPHMSHAPDKVAIIGAGSVGAAIAYACLIRGVARHVALFDLNRSKVEAEAQDLNHGLQFVPPATLEGSDDLAVCAGASVVVVTAGAKQHPGQSRMDLAAANTAICKDLIPKLQAVCPDAIFLLVTNPVDVITYVTLKVSGLPAARVIGSGTVLDSSRFRFLIAQRLRVAVQNVHAYIAGEHGDSEVPLWSSASVGNVPLHEWAVPGHGRMTVRDRVEIFENVKSAAQQIIAGKGATNYAIGLSTAQILEALLNDANRILAVSALTAGQTDDGAEVCMSLPRIVSRAGAGPALPVPLNENERLGLRESGKTILAAVRGVGF